MVFHRYNLVKSMTFTINVIKARLRPIKATFGLALSEKDL